jgi:hypothetical protein
MDFARLTREKEISRKSFRSFYVMEATFEAQFGPINSLLKLALESLPQS